MLNQWDFQAHDYSHFVSWYEIGSNYNMVLAFIPSNYKFKNTFKKLHKFVKWTTIFSTTIHLDTKAKTQESLFHSPAVHLQGISDLRAELHWRLQTQHLCFLSPSSPCL